MMSFGAQIENQDQFMPTYKVKEQIYHRDGSLLPIPGENHAVVNEGDTTNVRRLTILPSSYVGSPCHMDEFAQDAIADVRLYGRPHSFIKFTCH